MPKNASKFIYWTPRIFSIIFIAFLMLMSLDVFSMGFGFWLTVLALLLHNLPALILLVILLISWKYEIVGAVAFILAGTLYALMVLFSGFELYKLAWIIQISGMAFFIGILFYLGWRRKREVSQK